MKANSACKRNPVRQACGISRRLSRDKSLTGFTLIEVLAAVAVLGIGLVAVLHLFSLSTKSLFISRQYTQALLLGQRKMAEIESASEIGDLAPEGEFGEDWPEYTWEMEVIPQEDLENLCEVNLTVRWKKAGISRSFTLTTYRIVEERKL